MIGFRLHRPTALRVCRAAACLPLLTGLLWTAAIPPASAQTPAKTTTAVSTPPAAATAPIQYTPADDGEVKLGRENAEENDRQVKLVTDAALVERVSRIGQDIAAVANITPIPALWGSSQLKPFHYTFKVVDDKDVNAYSLPGGFIYVNRGLLDAVRSDDELAGVLAHEIGHDVHHHMVKLIKENNKLNKFLQPLTLLALGLMVGSRGSGAADASNLLVASQMYSIARMNSYGIDAEKDADHVGLLLMTHTRYNPVGLYSFMLRLAALERGQSFIDLGIYRTHPPAEERVAAAKNLLGELKIPILLSEVDPTLQLTVNLTNSPKNGALAEIKMRDIVVCRVAAQGDLTAEERARKIARNVSAMLDLQLQPFEVRTNREQTAVLVRGQTLLNENDALTQHTTIPDMARIFSEAVTRIRQKRALEFRT